MADAALAGETCAFFAEEEKNDPRLRRQAAALADASE